MTIEMTPLQEAYGMLSDMHKDAYGFRPRNYRSDLTVEEIHEEMDELQEIIVQNIAETELQEKASDEAFKKLVQDTIDYGAGDEQTALKWLGDAYELDEELDYFEVEAFLWKNGIMHTEYGKEIKTKLIKIYNHEA